MVRDYARSDADALTAVYRSAFDDRHPMAGGFHNYAVATRRAGGRLWVIAAEEPFGYAAVFPVPGLPHIVDLVCAIASERRGWGYGSRLIARVLADLAGGSVRQVAHRVESLASPAAGFLRRLGFQLEHEEWILQLDPLHAPRAQPPDSSLRIVTLPRQEAIRLFQQLYEASFAGLSWYQPFSTP